MALSAIELMKWVDREANYDIGGFTVAVTITDVREAWGSLQFEILPVRGTGTKWVNATSVRMVSEIRSAITALAAYDAAQS